MAVSASELEFGSVAGVEASQPKVCYIKRKNSEILSKRRNSESAGGSGSLNIKKNNRILE